MIRKGTKTASRRDWKKKMAKVDGVYPCQTEMFQPKEECKVFIKVTDLYRQKLGDMKNEDFWKEGNYSPNGFKRLWKRINGSWNPGLVVWVIEFRPINYPSCKLEDLEQ